MNGAGQMRHLTLRLSIQARHPDKIGVLVARHVVIGIERAFRLEDCRRSDRRDILSPDKRGRGEAGQGNSETPEQATPANAGLASQAFKGGGLSRITGRMISLHVGTLAGRLAEGLRPDDLD